MPWYFGDFMATLADLSGAQPPADIDGDSFAGPLKGTPRTNQWKREHEIYWEFYERGSAQAVRFGKSTSASRCSPARSSSTICPMMRAKKGLRQAPPDLARHAANLMENAHARSELESAQADDLFQAPPIDASSITSRCSFSICAFVIAAISSFSKVDLLGRSCEGYADGSF